MDMKRLAWVACVLTMFGTACPGEPDPGPALPDATADAGADADVAPAGDADAGTADADVDTAPSDTVDTTDTLDVPGGDADAGADADADAGGELPPVDDQAPSITVTEPLENAAINGGVVVVAGSAIDEQGANGVAPSGLESLLINGDSVTAEPDGSFSWTLSDLTEADPVITVEATDVAGNVATTAINVTVTKALAALAVTPSAVVLTEIGQTHALIVEAIYSGGDDTEDITDSATYVSAATDVATVDAAGVITAVADGDTVVTVTSTDGGTYDVTVHVQLDLTPPDRPEVFTWVGTTDLAWQSWIGRTEANATLSITSGGQTAETFADDRGRWAANLALELGDNVIEVVVTDAAGNASDPYEFSIRHDPNVVDVGALNVSSGDQQETYAGAWLFKPLVVKASDNDGGPLVGAKVRFNVTAGDGRLAGDDPELGGEPTQGVVEATTDGMGYARAWFRADTNPFEVNMVTAQLDGDTGLPVVFEARAVTGGGMPTRIGARVLDENLNPVPGATVSVTGLGATMTDGAGRFSLGFAPLAAEPTEPTSLHVLIDGFSASNGNIYARIPFDLTVLPGRANDAGILFVPKLDQGVLPDLDAGGVVQTTLVLEKTFAPGAPPTTITVPAGTTITWPDDITDAQKVLSVVAIPAGRTPMPLADGLFGRQVIAVQPGGTVFDPPLPAEFPNVDGNAPGSVQRLMRFDHDSAMWVQGGTATTSADGTRVVTDPGSGIPVGAWHSPTPTRSASTTAVTGTCKNNKGNKNDPCTIILPDGTKRTFKRGARFTAANVPSGGASKLDIECQKAQTASQEDEDPTGIKIVQPKRSAEGTIIVPLNKDIVFRARTKKPDGVPFTWRLDAQVIKQQTGDTGLTVVHKFTKAGKHPLSVTCGPSTHCRGSDSVIVQAEECCTAGAVRVCGGQMSQKAGDADVMIVSDEVTASYAKGDQFLKLGDGPFECDTKAKSVTGTAVEMRMDTSIAFIRWPNYTIFSGPLTIDGNDGAITFGKGGDPGNMHTRLAGFPYASDDQKAKMTKTAVSFDQPQLDIEITKDPDVKLSLKKIDIDTAGLFPSGEVSYLKSDVTQGAMFFGGFMKFHKLLLGYDVPTGDIYGGFGFTFGPKGSNRGGFEIDGTFGPEGPAQVGTFKKLSAKLIFSEPGIPLGGTVPLFLVSISGGVERPSYFLGAPVKPPVMFAGASFTLGPKWSAGCFSFTPIGLDAKLTIDFSAPRFTFNGGLSVAEGNLCGFGLGQDGLMSGTAETDVDFKKKKATVKGSVSLGFNSNRFDNDSGDIYSASIEAQLGWAKNFYLQYKTRGTLKFPSMKFKAGWFTFNTPTLTIGRVGSDFKLTFSPFAFGFSLTAGASVPLIGSVDVTLSLGYSFATGASGGIKACLKTSLFPTLCLGSVDIERKPYGPGDLTLDVPTGGLPLEIKVTHDAGVLPDFDVRMPDGTLLDADTGDAGAFTALFVQFGDAPEESTWIIYDAPAGTYTVENVSPALGVHEIVAARPDLTPSITLNTPLAIDADVVTVDFTADDPDSDALIAVTYGASPTEATEIIEYVALSDGVTSVDWDASELPRGSYFVCVSIDDGITPVVTDCTEQPIAVGGATVALAAPAMVAASELAPEGDHLGGFVATWTPHPGVDDVFYEVVAEPVDGGETVRRSFRTNRVEVTTEDGLLAGSDYRVTVTANAGDLGSPTSRAVTVTTGGAGPLRITSKPASTRLLVGETFDYTVAASGGGGAGSVSLASGPADMTLSGSSLSWTPSANGAAEVTLVVADAAGGTGASQSFTVVAEDPQLNGAPTFENTHPATISPGQAWSFTPVVDVTAGAAPALTLLYGPQGMTLSNGTLSWTPSAGDLEAGVDRAAFAVRADADNLLRATYTGVIELLDPDGDGLSTDYEVASGLDPFVADDPAADPDNDSLDHLAEQAAGTRGDLEDTDGDGITDDVEVAGVTDARLADTDGDGLSDGDEGSAGSDPTMADTDGDGLDDAAEVAAGTDPGATAVDTDSDGLSDDREAVLGTDPTLPDTDGDGATDAEEAAAGTDPLDGDSDEDGVSDGEELAQGTQPLGRTFDSDGDGVLDDMEVALGLDPTRKDTDGDGHIDSVEVLLGSDPKDITSGPPGVDGVYQPAPPVTERCATSAAELIPFATVDLGEATCLGEDSDGDGAPDDFEAEYGFDPFDASDGPADDDGDNLQLWQEAVAGTNPTLVDTDNDGVNDGQELADGTDPLDDQDFDGGGPITGLVVSPATAFVTVNSLLGFEPLQLYVTGTKSSGATVDLTAGSTGTIYLLNTPGAGSVSADGLYAPAGITGATDVSITVTNSGQSADVTVTVEPFDPVALGGWRISHETADGGVANGDLTAVAADDDSLWLAQEGAVLFADRTELLAAEDVAVTIPREQVAELGSDIVAMDVLAPRLAAATADGRVVVLDLASRQPVATIPVDATPRSIAIGVGGLCHVGTDAGILTVDIAGPGAMGLMDLDGDGTDDRILQAQLAANDFQHVAHGFGRVFATNGNDQLYVFDEVMNASGPPTLVLNQAATLLNTASGLTNIGSDGYAMLNNTLQRFRAGTLTDSPGTLGGSGGIAAYDRFVLVASFNPGQEVLFLGSELPDQLPILGWVDHSQVKDGIAGGAAHLAVAGDYHYAAFEDLISLGRHQRTVDLLGTPPMLVGLSPDDGDVFDEGDPIVFAVQATDDVGVAEVVFTVDGQPLATLENPPFEVTLPLIDVQTDTTVTLGATATDVGGNTSTLEPRQITLQPIVDLNPPAVAFLEPLDGDAVAPGQSLDVEVNAVDDNATVRVDFFLDDVLVASADAAPWRVTIALPVSPTQPDDTFHVRAVATDLGGGTGEATAILANAGVDLVASGITFLGDGDTVYDGGAIFIAGGTVAIDGAHNFSRVTIGPGGVLTHSDATPSSVPALTDLTVGEFTLEAGGLIDVVGKGYVGGCFSGFPDCPGSSFGRTVGNASSVHGTTSAPHGGTGRTTSALLAPTYGDAFGPIELGSGGGAGADKGGDGGGAIRISATTMVLEGSIHADAEDLVTPDLDGQGGSGGSVNLSADTLSGSATITARGGDGHNVNQLTRSGGGGGRIALVATDASGWSGTLDARGGAGSPTSTIPGEPGGPGTIYTDFGGNTEVLVTDFGTGDGFPNPVFGASATGSSVGGGAALRVEGNANVAAVDDLNLGDVTLADNARLSHPQTRTDAEQGLRITAGTITVGPTAGIDVSGLGYLGQCVLGPNGTGGCFGAGISFGNTQSNSLGAFGGGGSHGGRGGNDSGVTYGDMTAPFTLGAGAGYTSTSGCPADSSNGGGRVWITANALIVEGVIAANGADGYTEPANCASHGGGGGSVWIQTGSLDGDGLIMANGGAGGPTHADSGGGGGGRLRVEYETLGTFDLANATALGGSGGRPGGGGTALFQQLAAGAPVGNARLRIQGSGTAAEHGSSPTSAFGHRKATSLQADSFNVQGGAEWFDGQLVGKGVRFEGNATVFMVTDNSSSTVTVDAGATPLNTLGLGSTPVVSEVVDLSTVDVEVSGGAKASFDGRWTLANLDLLDGGRVTHQPHATGTAFVEGRLDLTVPGDVTIDATSAVDVSGLGHAEEETLFGQVVLGQVADAGSGGSHGGYGGGATPGAVYGSPLAPVNHGAGGGEGSVFTAAAGAGGGVIRLDVGGTLTLDGVIVADGADAAEEGPMDGGGGAGGSVWVTTDTVAGGGLVRSGGGAGGSAGGAGGGGGRVLLSFTTNSGFTLANATAPGGLGGAAAEDGHAGSVTTGTSGALTVTIDDSATTSVPTPLAPQMRRLVVNQVGVDFVRFSQGTSVPRELEGGTLSCESGATFTITDNTTDFVYVDADPTSQVSIGDECWMDLDWTGATLNIVGSWVLANQAVIVEGLTLSSGATLQATGRTSGFMPIQMLSLQVGGSVAVDSTSTISAEGAGYFGQCMTGAPCFGAAGQTLSGFNGSTQRSGGSHIGTGGGPNPGDFFDNLVTPLYGGGGGAHGNSTADRGAAGGGIIRLVCDALSLDGVIHADGSPVTVGGQDGGAGAGGTVWITATNLSGTGSVRADGGNSPGGGGGGGGAVRIEATGLVGWSPATVQAAGGTGGAGNGAVGGVITP